MEPGADEEREDAAYLQGEEAVARSMLRALMVYLKSPQLDLARANIELSATRSALRELSKQLGCDDWPDSLHLADVVRKYIGRSIPGVEM